MMLLEVDDIHAFYGAIEALKGISLTVDEGEVVTLIGSNGAGKSTTLRSVSGLTPASAGSVRFNGEDITRAPAAQIVERIYETIAEINRGGVAILLVEQNANYALDIARRGYVLETGQVAIADDSRRLRDNPEVQRAYLGG